MLSRIKEPLKVLKKGTQKYAVYEYMTVFGSISPMEAFADLGITKLATRISEMRRMGIAIDSDTESTTTRLGKKTNYCRYFINKENENA